MRVTASLYFEVRSTQGKITNRGEASKASRERKTDQQPSTATSTTPITRAPDVIRCFMLAQVAQDALVDGVERAKPPAESERRERNG
jgi:hypothetical protein